MDKNEHDHGPEEQVEDLDTPESESEAVKGGFSWGATQGIKGELSGIKGNRSIKGELGGVKQGGSLDGWTNNHNETLVSI